MKRLILSPKGYASILEVPCRFNCLSICLYVCHVTLKSPWREGYEDLIFFRRMGLIAWLHKSMSRRNPSSRSDSSPKVDHHIRNRIPPSRTRGQRPKSVFAVLQSYLTLAHVLRCGRDKACRQVFLKCHWCMHAFPCAMGQTRVYDDTANDRRFLTAFAAAFATI